MTSVLYSFFPMLKVPPAYRAAAVRHRHVQVMSNSIFRPGAGFLTCLKAADGMFAEEWEIK